MRVVIDACAVTNVEHAASGLRAAAGPRHVEVIALMPPDADSTLLAGVNRCVIKPLCTPDLVATAAPVDPAHSMRVRALPMSGSRGRALVVEDNAVNQEMARAMLDMLGFEVVTASNGREGVAAAAANPDLVVILMDCQMPVMDGLAASRAIRSAERDGSACPSSRSPAMPCPVTARPASRPAWTTISPSPSRCPRCAPSSTAGRGPGTAAPRLTPRATPDALTPISGACPCARRAPG